MGNRFDNNKKAKGPSPLAIGILELVVIIGAFVLVANLLVNSRLYDEKKLLEKAISRDIVHCYALEGAYPASVSYMEDHYGLSYDHERFIIDYELQGDNILPTYMVIERSE